MLLQVRLDGRSTLEASTRPTSAKDQPLSLSAPDVGDEIRYRTMESQLVDVKAVPKFWV